LFDRSTPKKATEKTHATMPEILPYDLFAGHIGKWAPEMMCLGEIGPLQGRNIRLMEEIRRSPVDMVNVPIISRVSYMSGGWPWDFWLPSFPYLTKRGKKWKIMDSIVPAEGYVILGMGQLQILLIEKAMFDVEAKHNAGNDV